jgi:hypothetical protein
MKPLILVSAFLLATVAKSASPESAATNLLNVGIRVEMKFDSFGQNCNLAPLYPRFNLSVQMEHGMPVRARISKLARLGVLASQPPSIFYDLTATELQTLDVRTDQGLSWVKSVELSPEATRMLADAGKGLASDACVPPAGLRYSSDQPVSFDFGVEEVGYLLPKMLNSNSILLRGMTAARDPFQIEMTLTQDRI